MNIKMLSSYGELNGKIVSKTIYNVGIHWENGAISSYSKNTYSQFVKEGRFKEL